MDRRIAADEFENQRAENLAPGGGEGVDAQRARRRVLLRANGVERVVDVGERRRHLLDEPPPRLGQRDAARGAVEQPHAELRLELGDRVAERAGRYAQIERGATERAPPPDRQHCIEIGQAIAGHCPDIRNSSSSFILLIRTVWKP
jgi:hypothetical protein